MATSYEETIILEISERDQIGTNPTPGSYEVTLPRSITINPGDRISFQNTFLDTSQIDLQSIFLEDDVNVVMDTIMYVRNFHCSDRLFVGTAATHTPKFQLTDNKPYVLSEFTPKVHTGAQMGRFRKIIIQRVIDYTDPLFSNGLNRGNWLADSTYTPSQVARLWYIPYPGGAPQFQTIHFTEQKSDYLSFYFFEDIVINITCVVDHVFPANFGSDQPHLGIEPAFTAMKGIFFDCPDGYSPDVGGFDSWYDGCRVLFGPAEGPLPGGGSADYRFGCCTFDDPELFSDGLLTPVPFKTSFTVPKGEYNPIALAELVSTKLNKLQSTSTTYNGTNRVEPTGEIVTHYLRTIVHPDILPTAYHEFVIPIGNVLDKGTYLDQFSSGWSVRRTRNNYVADPAVPAVVTFQTESVGIISVSYAAASAQTAEHMVIVLETTFTVPTVYNNATAEYTFTLFRADALYPGSTLLQLSDHYNQSYVATTLSTATTSKYAGKYFFSNADSSNLLLFQKGSYWIGASAVKMEYDVNKRRMSFPYLHSPITGSESPFAMYSLNSVLAATGDLTLNAGIAYADGTDTAFYVPSNAGIAITHLSPSDFWFHKCGFEPTEILTPIGNLSVAAQQFSNGLDDETINGAVSELTIDAHTPVMEFVPGTNITAASESLGSAIGAQKNFYSTAGFSPAVVGSPLAPVSPTNTNGRIDLQETDVTPIVALNLPEREESESGYFVVDVQCGFGSTSLFMGSENAVNNYSRNIRMVVDRYYTQNSFTSSTSDGTSYTHVGVPSVLRSIRVRILDKLGNLVPNLGKENSVFLRLTKTITTDPSTSKTK